MQDVAYTDYARTSQNVTSHESGSRSPSPTSYFEDSLYSLFAHNQPAHGDPGDVRTYSHPNLPIRTTSSQEQRRLRYGITQNSAANNRLFAHFQWDAGLYLADLVAEQSHGHADKHIAVNTAGLTDTSVGKSLLDVRGKHVVELGAGTGLPGLVACLMGAKCTVLTDYPDELILANLSRNVELADLKSLPPSELPSSSHIQVQGLEWGNASQEAAALEVTSEHQGFDIVLAADVLWVSSAHASLIRTIRCLLRRHTTARCIVVAGYHTGRPAVRRFFGQLKSSTDGQDAIVPDWETKFGGIWERHVDGSERSLATDWQLAESSSAVVASSINSDEQDMGDISDRSNWVVIASLRWARV